MDHPEKATRKRKPKPNAQTSAPSTLPISPSLAAQPTAAPGAIHTTRLKMTLHSLTKLDGDADNPLTRCTFGAVYSANPTEEDGVFGKYTPYGSLSYNVRSDIAAHLEEGEAYYVDITKVPS